MVGFGAVMLAAELAFFLFLAAGTHGWIVPLKTPTSTDFVSFYAAGSLADAGTPQLAYDRAAHYAAEQRATERGIGYNFFYYPPPFLLVCAALAWLPYLPAFAVFEAVGLGFYVLIARRILGEHGWAVAIPIIAFPPVLWTIGLGQNGLLTGGLLGAATLLVDRQPAMAGLLFGALVIKPHFALLVPLALAAGGRWRTFAAAAAAAIGLCLLSLALFGWQTWHDFLRAAASSGDVYAAGRIPFTGFVTPFGAARLLGASATLAGVVQGFASLAAGAVVAVVWRRNPPLPLRAASLAAATLVAVPLALFYDLALSGIAGAWLLRAEGRFVRPEWGKAVLVVLYALTLNPRGIAIAWQVPIGSLVAVSLFALAAAHALRRAGPARAAPPSRTVEPGAAVTRAAGVRDIAADGSIASRAARGFRKIAAS